MDTALTTNGGGGFMGAFISVAISFAALYVSFLAYTLARRKNIFEMFPERYKALLALQEFIDLVLNAKSGVLTEEESARILDGFYTERAKSLYLFGDDIYKYINEIHHRAKIVLIDVVSGERNAVEERKWLNQQREKSLEVFSSYLSVSLKNPGGWIKAVESKLYPGL